MYKKITPNLLKENLIKINAVLIILFAFLQPAQANYIKASTTNNKVIEAPVKVSGTITDEKGLPLPGVSVYEKKSHKGTASDINGKYSITVEQGSTLVFAFVGYTNQEVVVGSQTQLNIKLMPSTNILNEVVAIG